MPKDTLNRIQIELHVPDFDAVLDFYGKLGFRKVSHDNDKADAIYLVMERDGAILNFWPGNDSVYQQSYFSRFPRDTKRGYGVEIVYTVDDIDAYYAEVSQFANVVGQFKERHWGLKDFRIEDPFGYYLRITERHDILDPGYGAKR